MKPAQFQTMLLDGHKGAAAEVPFDPAARWSIPARPLWRGRRGHKVRGTLNGVPFKSAIVPRSRRFYLLVDEHFLRSAGVTVGEVVAITVEPLVAEAGV